MYVLFSPPEVSVEIEHGHVELALGLVHFLEGEVAHQEAAHQKERVHAHHGVQQRAEQERLG